MRRVRPLLSPARRCAVLGSPIAHSLSPALHRAGYAAVGLDWSYDAHDVDERALPGFLDGLAPSWRGLSLTMPLKRTVLPLLDDLSPGARRAQVVNTVLLDAGRRFGDNTDVPGAAAAIRERYAGPLDRAVILGGGATAASALLALADLGCRQVELLVRDPKRAEQTLAAAGRHPNPPAVTIGTLPGHRPRPGVGEAARTGEPAEHDALPADILVSTIPAGAQDAAVLALVDRVAVVFDVVYDPWPTPLAARAARLERTVVSGLDLLVHQAAGQFRLMTGVSDVPLEPMRAAGLAALGGGTG
ncbi:MAG TPA: shikimate dehydrogenase [Nocardioidaceae bacterium]|nr:shikimate dehydrogenase [Nocardioidaceae bacterium]